MFPDYWDIGPWYNIFLKKQTLLFIIDSKYKLLVSKNKTKHHFAFMGNMTKYSMLLDFKFNIESILVSKVSYSSQPFFMQTSLHKQLTSYRRKKGVNRKAFSLTCCY